MPLTTGQLAELEIDIQNHFDMRFNDVVKNYDWFSRISTPVTTNQMQFTESFVLDYAQITESDIGSPPRFKQMEGDSTVIKLRQFDDGVGIFAPELTADRQGQLLNNIAELGGRAAMFPQDLATDVLIRGDTSDDYLIYDGQRFFANAHPKAGTTFDNLLAGTFDSANFQIVRTAMMRFFSDLGTTEPYGAEPNYVLYPPDIEVDVYNVLNNTVVSSSGAAIENAQKGLADPLRVKKLIDTTDWYVATTELGGVMPLLDIRHSEFGDFILHSENGMDTDAFRDHFQYRWWVRALRNVFPTRPETMIKVVNP
jgi:phage major head subunit gpT-like protein